MQSKHAARAATTGGMTLWIRASDECEAQPLDSEAPLFILYTSGSTGKPKGIKHTTAGYNLYAKKTFEWVFDHRDDDIYWCTADCGWITGHSYIVYGPLAQGLKVVMYEGAPNYPAGGPILGHRRAAQGHDLLHGAHRHSGVHQVGRRPGQEARPVESAATWHGGRGDQPRSMDVVPQVDRRRAVPDCRYLVANRDRWHHDEPAAGSHPHQAGQLHQAACRASSPRSSTKEGNEVGANQGGMLTIAHPWPGMLRGIWGDMEPASRKSTGRTVPGKYLAGDNARCDDDGYYWIMGRIDDVLNVSGHRLSTIEIESALVSHDAVAEAAAVGRPDDLKGEAIAVFVTLKDSEPTDQLREELRQHVRAEIGALAQPDDIRFTGSLPKTRSGKIMRRLLKDIAAGREAVGDTTTLEDYSVLAKLRTDDE